MYYREFHINTLSSKVSNNPLMIKELRTEKCCDRNQTNYLAETELTLVDV